MRIYIYENQSNINSWFGEPDYQVPFLATNLLSFNGLGFLNAAAGEEVKIYVPNHWQEDLKELPHIHFYDGNINLDDIGEYELVFITSLYSLFVGQMDDIPHLKQNPEKLFMNRGVVGGYLKRGQVLPNPEEDFAGFLCFVPLRDSNYLRLNQDLVGNLSTKQSEKIPSRVYGTPNNLSQNIDDRSTICGPCYIGKDVVIMDSYIGPGTILRGNARIESSKVYGSVIDGAVVNSSTLTDCIVAPGLVEGTTLNSSILPVGSYVSGR